MKLKIRKPSEDEDYIENTADELLDLLRERLEPILREALNDLRQNTDTAPIAYFATGDDQPLTILFNFNILSDESIEARASLRELVEDEIADGSEIDELASWETELRAIADIVRAEIERQNEDHHG